jgi:hypothetical protein
MAPPEWSGYQLTVDTFSRFRAPSVKFQLWLIVYALLPGQGRRSEAMHGLHALLSEILSAHLDSRIVALDFPHTLIGHTGAVEMNLPQLRQAWERGDPTIRNLSALLQIEQPEI